MNIDQYDLLDVRFISVYDLTEPDGYFRVCRKMCSDDTYVLFQAISTRGYDEGFYLVPQRCIYRVDVDDEYTKRIERLFHLQNQLLLEQPFPVKNDQSLLLQLLIYANKAQLITSFFLENGDDITGQIIDVDITNGCVRLEKLTQNGEKDGNSFINVDSIEKIICNSGVERSIEMLRGQGDGSVS